MEGLCITTRLNFVEIQSGQQLMWRVLKALEFGLVIGIVGVLLSFFHFAHEFEENTDLALLFKFRGPRKPPPNVIVVSLDRESSQRLAVSHNPDRWPRTLHAKLVETLLKGGAAAIIFDIYLIDPRTEAEDQSLAAAIRQSGNVVLAEQLTAKEMSLSAQSDRGAKVHRIIRAVKPLPEISRAAFATAPFALPRMPVRVNHYWTFMRDAGDAPAFPVVAFQLYAMRVYGDFIRLLEKTRPYLVSRMPHDAASIKKSGAIQFIKEIKAVFDVDPYLGKDMLQLLQAMPGAKDTVKYRLLNGLIKLYGGSRQRYLNYYGPPQTIQTVPYHEALKLNSKTGQDRRAEVKGKVVFVGLSEKNLAEKQDSFHTVYSQTNGIFISGVEIAATAFANLLEDRPVSPISTRAYVVLLVLWGVLIGVICRLAGTTVSAFAVLALSAGYFTAAQYQFNANGTWMPLATPLLVQAPIGFLGALCLNYFETNRERQNIRNALSHYVPREVVDQLARNRIDMRKGGERAYGICLFTDAAGYTTFSERFEPRELRDIMHRYFSATLAPIHANNGLVVDLKGDSILAVWKSDPAAAEIRQQACAAALELYQAVTKFNETLDDIKLPIRIGIHAGNVFLGNIGAGAHYEYGVTGDTVNTASRMDGLNKFLGTQILVSEEVARGVDGFLTREAGIFLLKGKTRPVQVHELLCRLKDAEEKQKHACALFADGLRIFKNRDWSGAAEHFCHSIKILGGDPLAEFYLKLGKEFAVHPPEPSWDGTITMGEK